MRFRFVSVWSCLLLLLTLQQITQAQVKTEGPHIPSTGKRFKSLGKMSSMANWIAEELASRRASQLEFLRTAKPEEFLVVIDCIVCEFLTVLEVGHTDIMERKSFRRKPALNECAAILAHAPVGLSPEGSEEFRRTPLVCSIGSFASEGGCVYAETDCVLPAELEPAGLWVNKDGGEGLGAFERMKGWHPEAIRLTEAGKQSVFMNDAFQNRVVKTGGSRLCPCVSSYESHEKRTHIGPAGFDVGRMQVLAEVPIGHHADHAYRPAFVVYGEREVARPEVEPPGGQAAPVQKSQSSKAKSIKGCILMPDYSFGGIWQNVEEALEKNPEARYETLTMAQQAIDRAGVLLNFMEAALKDKRARPPAPAAPAKAKAKMR